MAKFYMRELPAGMFKTEGNLCPTIIYEGVVKTAKLAEEISQQSTFTSADVKGLIAAIADRIAHHVSEGRSVHLEGIGSFRATLSLDRGKEETTESSTTRDKRSVHISGVRFRAATDLLSNCNNCGHSFERIRHRSRKEREASTLESRREALFAFLAKNTTVTATDYIALTGLNRIMANNELRILSTGNEAVLDKHGRSPHIHYTLRKKQ